MSQITILNEANTPMGPFTREQVLEKLQRGEVTLGSLAFVEGMSQWSPLREVMERVGPPVPPAPVVAAAVPTLTSPAPAALAPAYSYAATMQPPEHLSYAGFWLRVAAYFVDGLILTVPFVALIFVFVLFFGGIAAITGNLNTGSDQSDSPSPLVTGGAILIELVFIAFSVVVTWLYFAYLESGPHQATFGKRMVGAKVTDMAGQRLTFGRASGRYFGKIISGMIPFGIGYIMAGVTERKQALHDMIAGTLVVKN